MRNLLRRLKGELEGFRRRCLPSIDVLFARHAIERVIDFDAVQPAGVMLEKLFLGEAFRIEDWAPFFVAETGSPEPNGRHSGIIAQPDKKTPVNIDFRSASVENLRKTAGFWAFLRRFSTAEKLSGLCATCYKYSF